MEGYGHMNINRLCKSPQMRVASTILGYTNESFEDNSVEYSVARHANEGEVSGVEPFMVRRQQRLA